MKTVAIVLVLAIVLGAGYFGGAQWIEHKKEQERLEKESDKRWEEYHKQIEKDLEECRRKNSYSNCIRG